jgi:ABC-2 type transport system permease protein
LFPITTSLVSKFDWGPLLGSYLGMIFLAGFNVSICLFASSLTSSSVMSGFFGFLFILTIMIFGSTGVQATNPVVASIFEQLSLGLHLHDFFQGILNLKSFVFLISGISFFCFITHKMIENLRWK